MAYDRYETRRGWREPRSRFAARIATGRKPQLGRGLDRDDDREDRGFFERAGDEVASWFGDEEAERRRREDMRVRRRDEDSWRRPRAFMSDENFALRPQPAVPRRRLSPALHRPLPGPPLLRRRRRPVRPRLSARARLVGTLGTPPSARVHRHGVAALHDPHYSEWRRRQIDALDRDYDEYRRENQNRFENEFSQLARRPAKASASCSARSANI